MRLRLLFTLALVAGALVVLAAAASGADGRWQWPLAGTPVVSRAFDRPPQRWLPGHRGVDLRARRGEAVLAAGAGVIGYAGMLAGRGVVTVHHPGGLETTYEPVLPAVRPGQQVPLGGRLGTVTGGHGQCGPSYVCLHWGLRRGADYLDPLQLVGAARVRLLPLWDTDRARAPLGRALPSDSPLGRAPPSPAARAGAQPRPPSPRDRGPALPLATGGLALAALGGLALTRHG